MERKLTSSHLKWIALVTMFIDHFGGLLIEHYANANGLIYISSGYPFNPQSKLELYYTIIRFIGRLAFPLYVFLLVEGFRHTRDAKKYIARMGLFALISEIPFNLALTLNLKAPQHQNVFITLTLGLIMLYIFELLERKHVPYRIVIDVLLVVAIAYFNEYIGADYGNYGIYFIAIVYALRNNPPVQSMAVGVMGFYQFTGSLAGIITYFYSGRKGKTFNKYFFYIFYPAHLLIIYFIAKTFFK